jgi:L-rhamnose isomerase
VQCKSGSQAQVLVDTGYHAQGTNIEHIVAIPATKAA